MVTNCRFKSEEGKEKKTIAARILPGTDLQIGIIEICKKHNVRSGYVPVCFGSLKEAVYLYLEPKKEERIGAGYGERHKVSGPVELLGATGVVCMRNGEYELHMHATMCKPDGQIFGGHLLKGENPVLTTCDLIIVSVKGLEFLRELDEETNLIQFSICKKSDL